MVTLIFSTNPPLMIYIFCFMHVRPTLSQDSLSAHTSIIICTADKARTRRSRVMRGRLKNLTRPCIHMGKSSILKNGTKFSNYS